MPVFMANGPDEWIFIAEHYFMVNQLTDVEKLEIAVLCFQGGALAWYQLELKRKGFRNWEELKSLMLARFRSALEGMVEERFLALRQEEMVVEHRIAFKTLAVPIGNIS